MSFAKCRWLVSHKASHRTLARQYGFPPLPTSSTRSVLETGQYNRRSDHAIGSIPRPQKASWKHFRRYSWLRSQLIIDELPGEE